jgi:hypothetical protein
MYYKIITITIMSTYIPERSCDFTKYPKLFQNSYWGSYGKLYEEDREAESIIGSNRNKLVEPLLC